MKFFILMLLISTVCFADPVSAPSPFSVPQASAKLYDKIWLKSMMVSAPSDKGPSSLSCVFDYYMVNQDGSLSFANTPKSFFISDFVRVTAQNKQLSDLETKVVEALVALAHAQGLL